MSDDSTEVSPGHFRADHHVIIIDDPLGIDFAWDWITKRRLDDDPAIAPPRAPQLARPWWLEPSSGGRNDRPGTL